MFFFLSIPTHHWEVQAFVTFLPNYCNSQSPHDYNIFLEFDPFKVTVHKHSSDHVSARFRNLQWLSAIQYLPINFNIFHDLGPNKLSVIILLSQKHTQSNPTVLFTTPQTYPLYVCNDADCFIKKCSSFPLLLHLYLFNPIQVSRPGSNSHSITKYSSKSHGKKKSPPYMTF